jgi:hypothetical protein
VLIIANSFPPHLDSEAICTGKFVIALLDQGHHVKVVTQDLAFGHERVDSSKLWKKIDESIVFRIGPPSLKLFRKSSSVFNKLFFQLPEASWWTNKAIKMANILCTKDHFDVIISRGTSINCLHAGYKVSENKDINLITILNDPPFFCMPKPYINRKKSAFAKKLDLLELKSIINKCSLAVFPSIRLYSYIERILNTKLKDNVYISPHIGFRSEVKSEKNRMFSIVHAGKIDWGRSSGTFFSALKKAIKCRPAMLNYLELNFFGIMDNTTETLISKFGFSDIINVIKFRGIVNYEESLKIISEATAVLLIEAVMKDGIFLPSKFCDYVAAEKPLLLYSPRVGTIADFVENNHPGLLGQGEQEATDGLIRLFDKWLSEKSLQDYKWADSEFFAGKKIINELLYAYANRS